MVNEPELGWVALGVKPDLDARGFDSSLARQLDPTLDGVGRRAGSRFSAGFKRAAVAGIAGTAAAGAVALRFAGGALEEAREAQKVGAQTDAVIKSTGRSARVSAKDVGNLAGQLSNMAGIDDEIIQQGANVLLTFKNIRNEAGEGNKVFDKATRSALNMSVALDQDLKSASLQVGKALNDPVKGMTALGRAGVQFSEDQKAAIKTMVDSGDTLGAQKMILRELNDQFKGSARAQATEADKLSVAWGNFKEEIGSALIPVMDDLSKFFRKEAIPAAKDFADYMREDGVPIIKDVAKFAGRAGGAVKDLAGFLNDLPDPAKYAGLVALVGGVSAGKLRGGGGGALGTVGKVAGLAKPVPVFVTNKGFGLDGGTGGKSAPKSWLAALGFAGVAGAGTQAANENLAKQIGKENAIAFSSVMSQGGGGGMSIPREKGGLFDFSDDDDVKKKSKEIEGLTSKVDIFRESLFLAGSAKVDPRFGTPGLREASEAIANFIDAKIQAGEPVAPYINTTSIERALGLLRTMNAEIAAHASPERGVDNGVTYQHGGGRSVAPRAGVTIERMDVHGVSLDDALRDGQRRMQRQGLGGFR